MRGEAIVGVTSTILQKFNHIIKGVSSVFALFGRGSLEASDLKTGFEQDREAIAGDWELIGNDMRIAINHVARER